VTAEVDKKLQGLTSNVDIIKHIVYYLGPISIGDLAAKMAQVMLSFQPDEKSVRQYITPILTKLDYYVEKDGKWEVVHGKLPEHLALPKVMEEEHRLAFYKRIADICLFVLGVFPEHVQLLFASGSPEPRPPASRGFPRRTEDFIEEGRKFYRKASEHPAARTLKMAERYISLQRGTLFGN